MPTNVIMPQMGESIAEGTITKWFKKAGEQVTRDEPLFEISTDKVDAEIPAPAGGVLTEVLVQENETVPVNTVVAVIDGAGARVAPDTSRAAADQGEGPQTADQSSSAAHVSQADGSDANHAPEPRTITAEQASASTSVSAAPAGAEAAPKETEYSEAVMADQGRAEIRSSPLVRRIAHEHNVDLARVRGTGTGGRISKKDILDYLAQSASSAGQPAARSGSAAAEVEPSPAPGHAAPAPAPAGGTTVVPMTPMRRQIAEHMMTSRRTSAHVSTVFEVEMTRVADLRAGQAQEFERRHNIKLTYTPFFVRAAVEAIKAFPILNASVESANIVYKRGVNLGIAVALETGLIVPVIKRADEKNFLGIALAVNDLAERARTKRLSVDDVHGGTFTITNPGIFGSLFGTPIINQPQVAILGTGLIEKRAVIRNDAIAIRPMVYLALSFDHRIIDGAVADQFMAKVRDKLEAWEESVL
jgi:2-oxoglutarate dehydrogenase E2 component (dihydrolipoamide succinyltransferase)